MSEQTSNLKLSYILPSQAQKHVTCNETFRILDAVVHLSVMNSTTSVPPFSPVEGERYIVPFNAAEIWSGQQNKIAAWQDGIWSFYSPQSGWLSWVVEENRIVVFDGSSWVSPDLQNTKRLGVNARADDLNRFVVCAEASLFDHMGQGHRHKINKATSNDTASLIFQTSYSARAEIGLCGDDLFRIKISSDGEHWHDSIVCVSSGGNVGIGTANPKTLLDVAGALRVGQFSKSTLPDASNSGAGAIIYVQDKRLPFVAFSDGTSWRCVSDGSLVL